MKYEIQFLMKKNYSKYHFCKHSKIFVLFTLLPLKLAIFLDKLDYSFESFFYLFEVF